MVLEAIDRASGPLRRVGSLVRRTGVDTERLGRITERWGRRAEAAGRSIGLLAGAITGLGLAGIAGIVKLGAEFEQFQIILEQTEGSAEGARRAMAWVREFGKRTPFEIGDVMQAFVSLKNYGIDPMAGSLQSLGNAASAMNKPLSQAVEALADAQVGEFERLKEFGIRASKQGDMVRFSYLKAGKEITRTARINAAEINRSLTGIFDDRFAGMMDRQSQSLAGLWSNLKDFVTLSLLDIGEGGFLASVRKQLQRLLAWLEKLKADGTLKRWVDQASAELVRLANFVASIDWVGVARDIAGIARAIGSVVGWLERLGSVFGWLFNLAVVAVIARISFGLYALASALRVVSIAGAPLAGLVTVIGLLAAGAFLVWLNWSTIAGFFSNMVDTVLGHIRRLWPAARDMFRTGVQALWNALPAWFRGILTGASFVVRAIGNLGTGGGTAAPAANTRPRPALAGQNTAQVGGRLDIRISGDGARQASVQGVRTANRNVPIRIERHPAMAGAA